METIWARAYGAVQDDHRGSPLQNPVGMRRVMVLNKVLSIQYHFCLQAGAGCIRLTGSVLSGGMIGESGR